MAWRRGAGQPDSAPARINGVPVRARADGRRPQGYPPPDSRPASGYARPGSGPTPRYRPSNDRTPAHRRPRSGPFPAYPPPDSRPASGYARPGSGPTPRYRPSNDRTPALRRPRSGPFPAYPPPDSGGVPRGYPQLDGSPPPAYPSLDGGPGYSPSDSKPFPAYRPLPRGPAQGYPQAGDRAAPGHPLPDGKRILGWLPFGNRLVLLPRGTQFDGGDRELREHRDVSGGWLRPAVFGAMDGLVTNASLIAGVGGGGGGRGMIVLTGIAGLVAGAFSMATGEYISVTSQNELASAEVELERMQHLRDPQGKLKRLTEIFIEKGVSPNLAEAVVRQVSADPDRAVSTHVREELGIDPDDLPSPRTAAAASFAAFTVGALIPLSPFLLGFPVLTAALVIAGVAAVAGGAAVAKLTGRPLLMGGLRQFTAAFLATGMAFAVGQLIGGHVS